MNRQNRQTQPYQMGLDIGSTTIKAAVLSQDRLVFSLYRRHHSDIMRELSRVFQECAAALPGASVRLSVTGSGGVNVAQALGLPFVQEVIAETEAIQRYHPRTDVIIELGGEDAKITYLHPVPEQRMNGTCAGGTGAFIDQMAVLLQTDAAGLDQLASCHRTLYPIASRCGVFAKSDLQPLINEGAERTDLAASIFQSVVNQTIAGLACGRPIRGHIVFLGGPLHFLPQLRRAFETTLADAAESFTTPEHAQLYVALGAALLADQTPVSLRDVSDRVAQV
ncbi:MAG: BadF/BadG/BcrA/BcrD ATPase family protein, partial [Eubacteriales bacterium]|nr:BadF/BadG/BcrA/BcrD ATPase family protein [Eubacteriales bacterium]